MTQQLHLAANLVTETLIYGHLQIVYEDAAGNLFENETTSPGFPYFFGDWAYPEFGRQHDNTTNTPGYGNPNDYAIVTLNLRPEQTAEHVWELMAQIHASLSNGGHGLDYDIRQNSNSYITSVLSVVGINIAGYLSDVTPPDVQSFPGVGTNIFYGAKTGGFFSGYDTPIPLTIAGTPGNDYVKAGIGNDDLGGAGGNDTLLGGDGNDSLYGGLGDDTLKGGTGNDLLKGNQDNDTLSGDAGTDSLYGGLGNDTLLGGTGADYLFGAIGDDLLKGNQDNDTLSGDAGNDSLYGGLGNDTLLGGNGADYLFGAIGNDVINGDTGDDTLVGDAGNDQFVFFDGFGTDIITDFDALNDLEKIDLTSVSSITSYADLTNPGNPHMTQVGSDVVIDDFAGNTSTLLNVNIGDLHAADFVF